MSPEICELIQGFNFNLIYMYSNRSEAQVKYLLVLCYLLLSQQTCRTEPVPGRYRTDTGSIVPTLALYRPSTGMFAETSFIGLIYR